MKDDRKYSDEVSLIDGLIEFHPEWLESLSEAERSSLDDYYGIVSSPADLDDWRDIHVATDPGLAAKARAILWSFPGIE